MDMSPSGIRFLRGELSPALFAEAIGVSELSVRRWELPDDHPEARRPRRASRAALHRFAERRRGDVDPAAGVWAMLVDGGRWEAARDAALRAEDADPEDVRVLLGTVALLAHGDVDAACAATVATSRSPRGAALAAWLSAWPDGRVLDPDRCEREARRARRDPTSWFLARIAVARAADHQGDADGVHRVLRTLPPDPDGPVPRCLADALRARAAHLAGRGEEARVRWRSVASRARVLGLLPTEAEARLGLLEGLLLDGAPPGVVHTALQAAHESVARLRHHPSPAQILLDCLQTEVALRAGDVELARHAADRAEAGAASLRWSAPGAWPARLRLAMETGDPAATRTRYPLGGEAGALALQAAARWLEGDAAAVRTLAAAAALARTSGANPPLELLASTLAATVDPSTAALARAKAALERHPASWVGARLAPAAATHHQLEGREDEATWALQAALPVLDTARDGAAAASVGLALASLEDKTVASTPVERLVGPVTRLARRSGGADALLSCLLDEVTNRVPAGTGVELWEHDPSGRELLRTRRGTPEAPTLDRTLVDATGRTLRLRVGPLRRDDRAAVVVLVEVARLALRDVAGTAPCAPVAAPPGGRHPVLLLVEPGTDAEAIALDMHQQGPFVVLGRDPEPPNQAGGTRFVPEIGDLHPEAALAVASLLLDPSGPRVIAATAVGLASLERSAPELHRALAANAVPVPALRDRPHDLLALAEQVAIEHGAAPPGPEARAALLERPWPGNEAELRAAVAAAAEPGCPLSADRLP